MVNLPLILLSAILLVCIVVTSPAPFNITSNDYPELDQDSTPTHTYKLQLPHKLMDRDKHSYTTKDSTGNSERTSIKETLPTNGSVSGEVTKRFKNSTLTVQSSSEVLERNGRKLKIGKSLADSSSLSKDTLLIIKDLCLDVDYTEVIISSPQHLQQIVTYGNMENIITSSILIDVDNLESQLDGVKRVMLEDNKQLAYVLLDIQDNVTSVMRTIKAGDKNSRIVVISTGRVDPYQLSRKHGLYNIYIITTPDNCCCTGCHGRYDLYEICQYCNNGEDQVNKINKWVSGRGFIQPLKLPLSFKNTFNKVTFKVGTIFYPPQIYVNGTDANGNDIVTGDYMFHTLNTLSRILNATFKYIGVANQRELGEHLNDTVIQLVGWSTTDTGDGMLQAYGGVNTAYERIDHRAIVSAKPPRGMSRYGVVNVFDKETWSLIILSWVLGGAVLCKLRQHTTCGEVANYGDSYWTLAIIILWETIPGQNHHFSVSILLTVFMLAIMLLVTLYFGDLVAFMLAQDFTHPPIDNLEQMWATNKTVLTYWDWNELYGRMFNKSIDRFETFTFGDGNAWFVPAFEKIAENPNMYVSLELRSVFQTDLPIFMADKYGNHEFYIGKEGFGLISYNFNVQKDAYYEEAVNRGMLTMQATGIIQHIDEHYNFKNFVKNIKAAESRPVISTDPQMVTLQHGFAGGLVAMFAGYTISLASLIFDIFYNQVKAQLTSRK